MPLVQSAPAAHILPVAHVGQVPPPQSMSVSVPSLMPSVQLGWHCPNMQTFEQH